jgi:hypothetical protein
VHIEGPQPPKSTRLTFMVEVVSRTLLPFILIAVTLAWVGSASALAISFLEPISPTSNITVSVLDLTAIGVISTSPELASLTVGTAGSVALSVTTQSDLDSPYQRPGVLGVIDGLS